MSMLQFYGLREQPFELSPDPRFLWDGAAYVETTAALVRGIENRLGLAALIGEAGLGKTTILYDVIRKCARKTETAFIYNAGSMGMRILQRILEDLRIPPSNQDPSAGRPREFVARRSADRPVLIAIDDAQDLSEEAFDAVQRISDSASTGYRRFHLILSGRPELTTKLSQGNMAQLRERTTVVSGLQRLSSEETASYIRHRLRVAGAQQELFSGAAMECIATSSAGIPGEINRICCDALQAGFAAGEAVIGERWIETSPPREDQTPVADLQKEEAEPLRARLRFHTSGTFENGPTRIVPAVETTVMDRFSAPLQAVAEEKVSPLQLFAQTPPVARLEVLAAVAETGTAPAELEAAPQAAFEASSSAELESAHARSYAYEEQAQVAATQTAISSGSAAASEVQSAEPITERNEPWPEESPQAEPPVFGSFGSWSYPERMNPALQEAAEGPISVDATVSAPLAELPPSNPASYGYETEGEEAANWTSMSAATAPAPALDIRAVPVMPEQVEPWPEEAPPAVTPVVITPARSFSFAGPTNPSSQDAGNGADENKDSDRWREAIMDGDLLDQYGSSVRLPRNWSRYAMIFAALALVGIFFLPPVHRGLRNVWNELSRSQANVADTNSTTPDSTAPAPVRVTVHGGSRKRAQGATATTRTVNLPATGTGSRGSRPVSSSGMSFLGSPSTTRIEGDKPAPLVSVSAPAHSLKTASSSAKGLSISRTPGNSEPSYAGQTIEPTVIKVQDPVYPSEAQTHGIEGTVLMKIKIGADGLVKDIAVNEGTSLFVSAATDAVKKWTYHPAMLNGHPIDSDLVVKVEFTLDRRK